MDWLWSFLFYGLPWWAQALLLAVAIGVPVYLTVRAVWGADTANRLLLPLVGIIAALGAASKLKQDGYQDRRAEEEKALDKAEDFVNDKRQEIDALPPEKRDERFERWEK